MLGLDEVREVFEAGDGFDEAGFNCFADTDEVQISSDGELTGDKLGAGSGNTSQIKPITERYLQPLIPAVITLDTLYGVCNTYPARFGPWGYSIRRSFSSQINSSILDGSAV